MINTLIIHGSYGSPCENWFPWLAGKLSESGRRVVVPHFPDKDSQSLRVWTSVLDGYAKELSSSDLTVYAHSLGPAFVVDYFVARKMKVRKAVLVAPFYGLIGIEEFDSVNKTFFVGKKYLKKFSSFCTETVCVYSDNDPYVPIELSKEFATQTSARTQMVPGGKHLNASAGFREFPLLLQA